MAVAIRVPRRSQSAEEATLTMWLRAAGDRVRAGDAVATIETDKAEVDVEAPATGLLGRLRAYEGETYPIGALLVYVLADGEAEPSDEPASPAVSVPVSPRARAVAIEHGVDVTKIAGSGPNGLVTERDVLGALGGEWRGRPVVRTPMSSTRAATARHLAASWSATPQFVQMIDVDMTAAAAFVRAGHAGYTELVVGACAGALAGHPEVNAAYDDGQRLQFGDVRVGIAVDTEHGLVVPVVLDADRLAGPGLVAACRAAIERARTGQMSDADRAPASATVSNLGPYGIRAGVPVLNGPEAVLVFVGTVEPRPVVRDDAVVVRTMTTLSIAFDHRVVDGAAAATFSGTLRTRLQDPAAWFG